MLHLYYNGTYSTTEFVHETVGSMTRAIPGLLVADQLQLNSVMTKDRRQKADFL